MSELKAFNMPRYAGEFTMHEVYLKSEADKVIAEKDEKIDELEERIDELQKATDSAWSKVNTMYDELRYQKYKRCLAMAKRCKDMSVWWNDEQVLRLEEQTGNAKSRRFQEAHKKFVFFFKWHKRWLKIAEQFKEVK